MCLCKKSGILAVILSDDSDSTILRHPIDNEVVGCGDKSTIDLIKILLEASNVHYNFVAEGGTGTLRFVDNDGDPWLHGEIVDLYSIFLVFLLRAVLSIGTLPTVCNMTMRCIVYNILDSLSYLRWQVIKRVSILFLAKLLLNVLSGTFSGFLELFFGLSSQHILQIFLDFSLIFFVLFSSSECLLDLFIHLVTDLTESMAYGLLITRSSDANQSFKLSAAIWKGSGWCGRALGCGFKLTLRVCWTSAGASFIRLALVI